MERNQSPRTFKHFSGKSKAKLNKKEIGKLKTISHHETTDPQIKYSVFSRVLRNIKEVYRKFTRWMSGGSYERARNPMRGEHGNKPVEKLTNKEAKNRTAEQRRKRNTARHSRKTNSSRGKRKGK